MEKVLQIQRLLLRSRRLPWLVLMAALLVLAGAVLLTTLQVRQRIREQIVGRDGEVLSAVARLQYQEEIEADPGATGAAGQLAVLLQASQLKGVLGARLFDASGAFVQSFPPEVLDSSLQPADVAVLRLLKPVCRVYPSAPLSAIFLPDFAKPDLSRATVPLLEVNVPLYAGVEGPLQGAAQFLIEGQGIMGEFSRLDRHLMLQAIWIFVIGGGLLALVIPLAFRRLQQAYALVGQRTDDLLRANQELALAAKTSALGAVTAHLLHGLKNPLAGLQTFVRARETEFVGAQLSDWQQAVISTRKMQALVHEVVSLLKEEETGIRYEISLRELGEMIAQRLLHQVRERKVDFSMQLSPAPDLPNRVANLMVLILVNLLQNAIEASPAGGAVSLAGFVSGKQLIFEVRDQGAGFPSEITPFAPCRSSKEGGSGIGLALCKQLANHLGASLELSSNAPTGCVFSLSLPLEVCKGPAQSVASTMTR